MGRRALRKVDPALDLTPYLFELETLPAAPFDAQSFFGRAAPLEVEVGSGKGLFMQTAAEQHADRNFLGIEIARKYARYAAARLAKRELKNGKMLCGDGLRFFQEWLPTASVAAVHVYFPDPWWKKRHHKRRVMKPEFIADIHRVLLPGGLLHFWTDVREYFENTLELLAEQPGFEGPQAVSPRDASHDLDYRTHFERRVRLHGETVYRSQFQCRRVAPPTGTKNP